MARGSIYFKHILLSKKHDNGLQLRTSSSLCKQYIQIQLYHLLTGAFVDRDCMVVGFTTTYAINAYHY